MRILMLNYEFPPLGGGAANATYYLLKEFSTYSELSIDLVTTSTSSYAQEQFAENITIHYLDIGKNYNLHYQSKKDLLAYSWKAYRYSRTLLKKHSYDLVHAFFGIPSGYIAMKLGLPYIVSLRGSDVPFYNPRFEKLDKLVFQRLNRKIWRKANAVIANSQGLKDLALQTAPNQEIGIIYNGIDTSEFTSKKDYTYTPPLKLIGVGRLIPRKGFDYAIRALQGMDNVTLTLLGDGPEKENLRQLAEELNVTIHFEGNVAHEQIAKYYRSHDVFILPSFNEGMSNTVLEAMACGLPIITSNTGGTAELIHENGFVVDSGNPNDIRTAVESFLTQPNRLQEMGQKSYRYVQNMQWNEVAREYHNVMSNNIHI